MHNLCCDNCHSHVAYALNLYNFRKRNDHTMFTVFMYCCLYSRYFRFIDILRVYVPFLLVIAIIVILQVKWSISQLINDEYIESIWYECRMLYIFNGISIYLSVYSYSYNQLVSWFSFQFLNNLFPKLCIEGVYMYSTLFFSLSSGWLFIKL